MARYYLPQHLIAYVEDVHSPYSWRDVKITLLREVHVILDPHLLKMTITLSLGF